MNELKISIKTNGLIVRTKDLGMGLSILNRISNNGIMNKSFVSNNLLDRIDSALNKAVNALTKQKPKYIIEKSVADIKEPINKSVKSSFWTKEEIDTLKANKDLSLEKLSKMINRSKPAIRWKRYELNGVTKKYIAERKKQNYRQGKAWSDAELDIVKNNLDSKPSVLTKFFGLRGRSLNAITQMKKFLKENSQ